MTKLCRRCGKEKPAAAFYKRSRAADGLQHWCKTCCHAGKTDWRKRNPANAKRSDFYRRIKQAYGLTRAQYDALEADQNGRCAACHDKLGTGHARAVDHCHDTGRVRGLLCRHCNVALGHVRDDQRRLQSLIVYLNERG